MHAYTEDLQSLKDADITICLDQGLSEQNTSFFNTGIYGIYYRDTSSGKVLTLWDNGKLPHETGLFTQGPSTYGPTLIHAFAKKLRAKEVPDSTQFMYAGLYGKHHHAGWSTAEDFDQDSLKDNQQLLKPPVINKAPLIIPGAPSPR